MAAAFALLLAVTGLLLNHSDVLQLDRQRIRASWLVDLYGLAPPPLQTSREVAGHWVSLWGGQLFVDATPLRGQVVTTLIGAFAGAPDQGSLLIVTDRLTLLVTPAGELIDTLMVPGESPAVTASRLDDRIAVTTGDGQRWSTDLDGTAWRPEAAAVSGARSPARLSAEPAAATSAPHEAPPAATLPADLEGRISQWWRGEGISALQLVRDLHSGAVARAVRRRLLDLAAVALIILALTGLWLALRPSRSSRPSRPSRLDRPTGPTAPTGSPRSPLSSSAPGPAEPIDETGAARPTRRR